MARVYVGLDSGSNSCHVSLMDAEGKVLRRERFETSQRNLVAWASSLKDEAHVHLEATTLAGWIRRSIQPYVKRVVVSHARSNAWIGKDPLKRDETDALKLAELVRMNRVHEVYCPEDQARADFKQLVQMYDDMTRSEIAMKLKIKARLKALGVLAKGEAVYSPDGRKDYLGEINEDVSRVAIEQMYAVLDTALSSREKLRRALRAMSRRFPEVARFEQVPGVGLIGACRFSAYIQTPHRFATKQRLWRYCRLGIVDRSSDGVSLGRQRLDRNGCGALKDMSRKAFEGAMRTRSDNMFKRQYQASLQRCQGDAKVHARLNVQRKILTVLWSMWKGGTDFNDQKG